MRVWERRKSHKICIHTSIAAKWIVKKIHTCENNASYKTSAELCFCFVAFHKRKFFYCTGCETSEITLISFKNIWVVNSAWYKNQTLKNDHTNQNYIKIPTNMSSPLLLFLLLLLLLPLLLLLLFFSIKKKLREQILLTVYYYCYYWVEHSIFIFDYPYVSYVMHLCVWALCRQQLSLLHYLSCFRCSMIKT